MTGRLGKNELDATVRSVMKADAAALRADWTVEQSIERLRAQNGPGGGEIVYFYAVDAEGRLTGVVPTRRLLMSGPSQTIEQVMVPNPISVRETMTVLEACEFFVMYRMLALPVVDADGRLLGTVDVGLFTDKVFSVSRSQSNQDVFQLIGVHVLSGRRSSPWAGFRNRFPWLACNIVGGVACALLAGLYESLLTSTIVLAMFLPVVLTLAESVSIQSMTITLHNLHESGLHWRPLLRGLTTELLTAAMLGVAAGGTVAGVAWGWKGRPAVAGAIGASIFLAIVTACLLGVLLPALIRALRGNPRIAAGPVVLALADVATLMFYLNLAGLILR